MTISFPPRIEAAIEAAAAEYGQSAPEFLKHACFTAAHSREGFNLKLTLAPIAPDPAQPALPLGPAMGGEAGTQMTAS